MSKPINFNYSNSLVSTKQPMVSLKDKEVPNSFSVIATWSKPLIGGDSDFPPIPPGKPGPLKHWRKRLVPRTGSGMGRAGVSLDTVNAPGGSVMIGSSSCKNCLENQSNSAIITSNKLIQSDSGTVKPKTEGNTGGMCWDNAKNNVIRSGVVSYTINGKTDHSRKYYTTTSQYLKAKGRTYDQKLSIRRIDGNDYINPTTCQPYPASDSCKGSQEFYITSPVGSDVRTIYKPSNQQYAKQGAVESGTRIMRLRNSILRPQKNVC